MQLFGGLTICGMSKFFSRIASEVNNFLVMRNLCNIRVFLQFRAITYAFKTVYVVMVAVGTILTSCRLTQIFKSVVRPTTIDMVNKFVRPFARFIKPNQPMCAVMFPIQLNVDIPRMMEVPTYITNLNARTRNFPMEVSCLRIVSDDFKKMLMCYHRGILPRLV